MAGRAGEGLRKLGGEACYLIWNIIINRAGKKKNYDSPKSSTEIHIIFPDTFLRAQCTVTETNKDPQALR